MNYIIDGFNLAFKISTIKSEIESGNIDVAIQKLIHFVRSRINMHGDRVILVLDGQEFSSGNSFNSPGVKIMFSKAPQSADDIIRNFIRNTNNIRKWCVVSSDNEILYTAQDHGAGRQKSADFIRKTSDDTSDIPAAYSKKTNPTNIDLDYWRSVFGKDDDE